MVRRTVAAAFVLAFALAGSAAASRVDDGPPLGPGPPPSVTFVISGHGWGHGIGMSQYGALGYAEHGLTYDAILAHFFPGTVLGTAPARKMRVLVAEHRKRLTVSSAAPFSVRDAAGQTHDLPAGPVAFRADLALDVGGSGVPSPLPGPITFLPGKAPLELGRPYRGSLEVLARAGRMQAVNAVSLDSYVAGVIASEMPSTWPLEALKAQAVAVRSYALSRPAGGTFDVFADTRSQVYGGIQAETKSGDLAAAQTRRQVLLYGGEVASTFFFSTSGGRTAALTDEWPDSKPVPYLVPVRDPYDSLSPYHDWGPVAIGAQRVARLLGVPGRLLDLIPLPGTTGRAKKVIASGTLGDAAVAGTEFRRALDLRSTWLRIDILSLSRPRGPVVYGSAVELQGIARDLAGVTLEARPAGGDWVPWLPVEADPSGAFSETLAPDVTTTYRLATGGVTGTALRVPVAPFVVLRRAPGGGLTGSSRPVFPGAPVDVQRADPITGLWKTVATVAVDGRGRFGAGPGLPAGSYRAVLAPGHGYVAGTAAEVRVPAA